MNLGSFKALGAAYVIAVHLPALASAGLATTASGVAAVLHDTVHEALHIDQDARVLCYLSECAE